MQGMEATSKWQIPNYESQITLIIPTNALV